MPSTIVKLSSSDARAWTHNQPVWLDEHGDVARPVTREEQHAISKTLEKTTKFKQSFRADLPLLPLNSTGRRTTSARRGTPVQKFPVAFEIQFVGEKRVVTIWNGKQRYATGREVLTARLLADHGECVLHGRNGKCIGVLRDPFINQREQPTGPRVQWSRNPNDPRKSEAQRNELTDQAEELRVASVRRKKKATFSRGNRGLHSPKHCPNDCRGERGGQAWKIAPTARPPTVDEHHPMCQFAAAWAATLDIAQTTEVLYDLETSEVKRPAVPAEVEEADESEARTGLRQVTVAGRVYAVLSPKDAEIAAKEARGELDEEGDPVALGAAPLEGFDEDVEDAGDDATAEAAGPHVVPSTLSGGRRPGPDPTGPESSEDDRRDWATLDQLHPRSRIQTAGDVTARSYLTRSPGEAPTP